MNIKSRKVNYLFFIIISFPILDNLSGMLNLQISLLFRIAYLFLFFSYSFKYNIFNFNKIYFFSLVLITPIFFNLLIIKNYQGLSLDITTIIKILYNIIAIEAFYSIFSNKTRDELHKYITVIVYSLIIYMLFIISSFLFGVGYKSYGAGGSKGFMVAGNDVSLLLAISSPLVYYYLKNILKKKSKKLTLTIIYFISMALLMTKSGILGVLALCFLFFLDLNLRKKTFFLTMLLFFAIFIYNFLLSKFSQGISTLFDIYLYTYDKYGLAGVLFRGRQTIFELVGQIYTEMNIFEKLFGMGSLRFYTLYGKLSESYWGGAFKAAEMDIFDIFFGHGFIGISIIYLYIIKKMNITKRNNAKYFYPKIGYIIYLVHSLFAGHAINSPIVGGYLAFLIGIDHAKNLSRGKNGKKNN